MRSLALLLFIAFFSSLSTAEASVWAPWAIGPTGGGGVGVIAWSENADQIAAVALPWEIDGAPHHSLPFWHLQGGTELPLLPLRLELLWSRHRFDEDRIVALSTSSNNPNQERLLLRHQERAARLHLALPAGMTIAVQGAWRESIGEWESATDSGWVLLPHGMRGAEWFYGAALEWRSANQSDWRKSRLIRIEALGSRDHSPLYEGWEWQLVAGSIHPIGEASSFHWVIESALPHWSDLDWKIDSQNRYALSERRSWRNGLSLWIEWPWNQQSEKSLRWGPALRLKSEGDHLSSSQAMARISKRWHHAPLLPLRFQLDCGGEFLSTDWRGDLVFSLGITADLPGATWIWNKRSDHPVRTTIGWFDTPSAALPPGR